MNSTSSIITIESWFIPVNILIIIFLTIAVLLAIIFLIIIIMDKTCHTIPMLLVGNICLTGFMEGMNAILMVGFALHNDLKQIQYSTPFCFIISYLHYATTAVHNYSYVSSAIYRYITIVYPTRLFWQSANVQILLIGIGWFLGFLFPIVFIFTGEMHYNVDNQICLLPIQFCFSIVYIPLFVYVIPVHLTIFIYMKLVRFIRQMNQHITPANILSRAQRDLRMVYRIVILIQILFISGFSLFLFLILSFFQRLPKYHYRIGLIFVYVSILLVMIVLFQFTDALKIAVKKIIPCRTNIVLQAPTANLNTTQKKTIQQ